MPNATASASAKVPAFAQGHAYRHGIVPRRGHQAAGPASSAATSSANLSYGGGINHVGVTTGPPQVYLVFWGSQWGTAGTNSNDYMTLSGDPKGMAPYLQSFIAGLGTGSDANTPGASTWSGVMSEYCQGLSTGSQTCLSSNTHHVGYPTGGALAGVWVDESAAAPQQATANQIAGEAANAAAHFGNTSSAANRSAQYVIVSPTGTNPDDYNNPDPNLGFCAWHDYTGDSTLDGGGAVSTPWGGALAFTNLPYLPDVGSACGANFVNQSSPAGTLDGVSIIEGHEYAETITDQFPGGGWTDQSGEEDADKCAWISSGQGASTDIVLATGTFAVQSTWANDFNGGAGGCEINHPVVTNPTPPDTVTVSSPGGQASTVGSPVSLQINATDSDPTQPVAFSAPVLPPGLMISSSGLISGTPTATGVSSVTVSASDPTGGVGNATFSWTVVPPRQSSTSVACAPSSLTEGTATTCTATVSDTSSGATTTPTGTVSFSAGSGTFSSGICPLPSTATSFASCSTTYTPTATGSQSVTAVYAGDSVHQGSSGSASLTVAAPQTSSSGNGGSGSSGGGSQPSGGGSPPPTNTTQGGTPGSTTTTPSLAPPPPPKVTGPACPGATGRLSGSTLGFAKLGMTRNQVRGAYRRSSLRSLRYQDVFCLTPTGLTVGYPSPALMRALSASQRKQLGGRAIWATTANRRYSVGSVRAGVRLATAKRALGSAKRVVIGRVTWYFLSQRAATIVIQVQSGVVREVGIASKQLTRTAKADSLLARSLS